MSAPINLGATKISPSDFASQGNAILGIRDSGKTYTATYLAEELLLRKMPFVAFDPIGVWRFLRHGGAGHGFELIVAGGEHGDVPLTVANAPIIVRHAMEKNLPLVLDLYDMKMSKADWRRIVAACVRLLLYENKKHGLRHIFIEEAAEFVPQMVNREYGDVYAEIEKLARMGGNAMLGYTLINQRAEQVNKAVLELCDCLFLHRQKGRLSLTAIGKWLDFGDKKESAKVIESLPTLEQGKCWVWANGQDVPVLTRIPQKASFSPDRRAASDAGKPRSAGHMLDGLELEDPPKSPDFRKGIKAALEMAESLPPAVEVFVFRDGELAKLELMYREFDAAHRRLSDMADALGAQARELNECVKRASALVNAPPKYVAPPVKRAPNGQATALAQGPKKILQTLAQRQPLRLTMNQLGTLSGFTPSTMRTYLPGLRANGLIDWNADGMTLTESGRAIAGDVPAMPRGGEALLAFWMGKLSEGEGRILSALHHEGVGVLDMETLSEYTGYTASTLRTYIPTLRRNKLIDSHELKISPEFLE